MKGLINLKNKDDECFKWCHVRFINAQNKDPERIKKQDNFPIFNFPMKASDYEIIKERFKINVNVFVMKIEFFHYMFQKNQMNKY